MTPRREDRESRSINQDPPTGYDRRADAVSLLHPPPPRRTHVDVVGGSLGVVHASEPLTDVEWLLVRDYVDQLVDQHPPRPIPDDQVWLKPAETVRLSPAGAELLGDESGDVDWLKALLVSIVLTYVALAAFVVIHWLS